MPTTGPFNKTIQEFWTWSTGNRKIHHVSTWYRNGRGPFFPHPYDLKRTFADNPDTDSANDTAGFWAGSGIYTGHSNLDISVRNMAYARFVSEARGRASSQLGATLAEWAQSRDMIQKRVSQLFRAAKQLKAGRPFAFFQELGAPRKCPWKWRNRRSDPKKAADLWLEWWFGWSPLYGDIYDSVTVLEQDLPMTHKVQGKARSGPVTVKTGETNLPYYRWEETLEFVLRHRIAARVEVSEPYLYKATQLGLTNPVSVAWELVPFSFVVDWFVPIGQFLDSWTDLLGLTISEVYHTTTRRYQSKRTYWNLMPVWTKVYGSRGYRNIRVLSLPGPTVALRPYQGIPMTRAATAVSLLIQQLHNLRR